MMWFYEACKYYEIFQNLGFKKCAIVTSFNPSVGSIRTEVVGGDEETETFEQYEIYQKNVLQGKYISLYWICGFNGCRNDSGVAFGFFCV